MKLYLAGGYPGPFGSIAHKHNQKVLLSYIDSKLTIKYFQMYPTNKIFLDSGAFSAFTLNKKINIDDYVAFAKRYKDHIEVLATLDVIGDAVGTKKNTEYLESKGLKPLATFHFGSPIEELKAMCEKYDYIALGGLVPIAKDRPKMRQWLDYCFSTIGTKTKVHGFGVNAQWAWERYPFYSVDASSWLSGSHYRNILHNGKKYSKGQPVKDVVGMKLHTAHYTEVTEINMLELAKIAQQVTRLWNKRGVIWKE